MKPHGSIYGYIRVSTAMQAESGLSLEAQRRQITEYARRLAKRKKLKVAKTHADKGVSATKHGLIYRPAGAKLDAVLAAGDHVVIAKLDRAFRSTRDCVLTCERWVERGVTIHLLDLGVDTDSPIGRMLISILSTVAQWEAERIGERNRDCKAAMRSRGLSTNGHRRLGWIVGRNLFLRPNKKGRSIARRIKFLREKKRLYWHRIAAQLTRDRIRRPTGKDWTHQACWRLYFALRNDWE